MRKKNCFAFLLFVSLFLANFVHADDEPLLLFNYPPKELMILRKLDSTRTMSKEELKKWDQLAKKGVEEEKFNFYQRDRFFTYLYVAQSEAGFLSKQLKGTFKGTLDPVSRKIFTLFFSKVTLPDTETDPYSEELANVVFSKIKKRVDSEDGLTNEFKIPIEKREMFSAGLIVAKWTPWVAKPSEDYWPTPPPKPDSPQWKEEIKQIKAAQTPMTDEKMEIIYKWAGVKDPWSDDWRSMMNNYLFQQDVTFAKTLKVRTIFMIVFYDGITACITAKYHYLRIRPQVYDDSVEYQIPVPKHPSFPAGHSAEGMLFAVTLSHFFPEEKEKWYQMGNEAGLSRIWAGIHYPVDVEGGKEVGKKVADKVIERLSK